VTDTPREPPTRRLAITSSGDRNELEALQLEIRRLAREHGLEVTDIRIERVEHRPRRRRS
jgi:ABC-type uncharacterized transport system substrate-binding protein